MLLFSVTDVKKFMNLLFKKENLFHSYEARGVALRTFTQFDISCLKTEVSDGDTKYCLWSEVMPWVSQLVKGGKPPEFLKIILCISGDNALEINDNAKVLYATIKYEKGEVTILTGTAQKQFALDKDLDTAWDNYIINLLDNNGFQITR